MEQQKTSTMVELVLREQDAITALPSVVRSIQQFIQAPLLTRLTSIMLTNPSIARVEQILTLDSEDQRLEALECSPKQPASPAAAAATDTRPQADTKVVCTVFWLGAQHASLPVVEWALATSSVLPINEALEMAVDKGFLTIVQTLYPRVNGFNCACCKSEDALLESAASHGHLEVVEWLVGYRSKADKPCFLLFALRCAAGEGHLEIVKWIHAADPGKWTHVALEQATLHGQQHVMDWIFGERLPVAASFAMQSAAWKGNWDALAWLHDKYPAEKGDYRTVTVKRRRLGSQPEVAIAAKEWE